MPSHAVDISSSISLFSDKKEFNPDSHFRWSSIMKFIYTAFTFSPTTYNFDIFSKIVYKVRIFEFMLIEITVGIAYMFMDCFMKQYTRRIDAHKYMNPLLKGITYGLFLQTALWALIHAVYVADSLRFLASSLQHEPAWTRCRVSVNVTCVPLEDILLRCRDDLTTDFNTTSAHYNYIKSFKYYDRSVLTARFFVLGIVWLSNFFFSTVADDALMRIFKLAFFCRSISTVVTLTLIFFTTKQDTVAALTQILDANAPHHYDTMSSVEHVTYAFGIGFLGFYDLGTMSPYTMIDNAVIIFMLIFTALAFLRSWIVRVIYLTLAKCVHVDLSTIQSPHYLLFAVLPMSTEFLHAHKLYTFYIYLNIFVSTTAYLTMLTLTMSKLLHTEFRSVKNMYIVGLLCCFGFGLSLLITISMTTNNKMIGLIAGLNVTVLYLGGYKSAVMMWMYGVRRFSKDIHFWLGFKPTKFWTICWMFLPIALSSFLFMRVYELIQSTDFTQAVAAAVWIAFSVLVVTIFQINTIAKYIVRNNLPAIFKSSIRYGPPDPEHRKRRRNFNETTQLRQCMHNCHILDDNFECNHMPIISKKTSAYSIVSEPSVRDIFEEGPSHSSTTRLRNSVALETESHH